jgi:O-antigen/teichoic acid export membrane protein
MFELKKLRVKVFHLLGIDRAVFFAISGKIWTMVAGLITTLLIASFFPPELQGYYYTFLSVLALQVFAELGLGTVISAYASHEWAKLAIDAQGRVSGDPDALSRLISLGGFALRWYLAAAAVVAIFLTLGGFVFFGSTGWDQVSVWGWPWAVLCLVTGINLCFMPVWALLEGCNQVSNVYVYRLIQSVASSTAAWVGIYLGAGLWVTSIIGIAGLMAMVVTVGRTYSEFIRTIMFGHPAGPHLNWRVDILPMQWRVSLSWLSGYFTFSLFTPVLFHYHGAVVAGQMGMTWAFIAALTAVASSWIAPKAPYFGMLIAQRKYVELDRVFWRLTAVVMCVTLAGALGVWVLVYSLGAFHHPLASRLLPPSVTACLLVATIILVASLPMSTYLRAHKKEPLLGISIVSGVLTGFVVVLAGKYYSVEGVALGYLGVMAVVTPFVGLVWQRCRAEWHVHTLSNEDVAEVA